MNFQIEKLYIPDGLAAGEALPRTTELCIAAHQDDIEIMAYSAIAECYNGKDKWFSGVTVTDGGGSPRIGDYAGISDIEMRQIRAKEQRIAADIGRYAAQFMLDYKSEEVKRGNARLLDELKVIIQKTSPTTLYTHNLADKHDTHVAVALQTIRALRELPLCERPARVVSLEVWRGLDWLLDEDKVVLDTSSRPNLQSALLGSYDSQISGGRRYDRAAIGRWHANATFFEIYTDSATDSMAFGLDITDLANSDMSFEGFIEGYIERFKNDVIGRIKGLSG